jgi:2-alkenal reductase
VKKVVPVLIEEGTFQYPWLGISGLSLSPELAEAMNLERSQQGALIIDVVSDSPADEAGLQGSDRQETIFGAEMPVGGDIITAIDGEPVKEFGDLVTYLVLETEIGQNITLTVLRDGEEMEVPIILGARPEAEQQAE